MDLNLTCQTSGCESKLEFCFKVKKQAEQSEGVKKEKKSDKEI